MCIYTYAHAEMHREDFKSRMVLVWQNLINNQATHKAEKCTFIVLIACAVAVQKHKEPCSTDGKVTAVT